MTQTEHLQLNATALKPLIESYHKARAQRKNWESLWQDCYDLTLPQRGGFTREQINGDMRKRPLSIFAG